jgi:hypothetical protein
LLAVVRVVLTYRNTAPAFDEPCHIAAGIELLDHHTYTLDPVHPPLSRVAIGLPLYLAGARFPDFPPNDPDSHDYTAVGNRILYERGQLMERLTLARSAMLPFLVVLTVLVFLWARRDFGDSVALVSVVLFTTLPIILALSGIAYTDLPTATTQVGALFAFTWWLDKPSWRATGLASLAVGLALLTKFTGILFLGASFAGIVFCKWKFAKESSIAERAGHQWVRKSVCAAVLVVLIIWCGYGFSAGHVQEGMQVSPANMPSFQHFPAPLRALARGVVLRDAWMPAPALFRGLAETYVLNKQAPLAYTFGRSKIGGWWYFFLIALAFKAPLPFLILSAAGLPALVSRARQGDWKALAAAASVVSILLITLPVKYNAGVRHILVVFPLLAIMAGCGCAYWWRRSGTSQIWCRVAIAFLVFWQLFASLGAQSNFLAYFNDLAGRDPSHVLVTGCDLECGQDVFLLASELRARGISEVHLALWSSADMSQMGLPRFDVLQPYRPVSGWVAIGARSLRLGEVFHSAYPPDAFGWLAQYHPVKQVGKTIWLYHITQQGAGPAEK